VRGTARSGPMIFLSLSRLSSLLIARRSHHLKTQLGGPMHLALPYRSCMSFPFLRTPVFLSLPSLWTHRVYDVRSLPSLSIPEHLRCWWEMICASFIFIFLRLLPPAAFSEAYPSFFLCPRNFALSISNTSTMFYPCTVYHLSFLRCCFVVALWQPVTHCPFILLSIIYPYFHYSTIASAGPFLTASNP